MNLYLIPVAIGAVMILNPHTAWVGVGLVAIGAILYGMSQKEPVQMAAPRRYMQVQERMSRPGVEVTRRNVGSDLSGTTMSPYQEAPSSAPRIEGGMFKLPLPIDPDVARFTDVTYNVPTKARNFRQEKDKGGNPWLPGF